MSFLQEVSLIVNQPMEIREKSSRILQTRDIVSFFSQWSRERQECFLVMSLSIKMDVIGIKEVSRGTLNEVLVHPREVFFPAICDNAYAIIIAHNHPSGDITPSPADIKMAGAMAKAGKLLFIQVVDCVIFNGELEYYSFYENNCRFYSK